MKRSKLILLTISIMLVLYCGAVIFLTKPDDFAYSFLFGESRTEATEIATAPVEQKVQEPTPAVQPVSHPETKVEQAPVNQPEVAPAAAEPVVEVPVAEEPVIESPVVEQPVEEPKAVEAEDIEAISERLEATDGIAFQAAENPIEISAEEYDQARTQARDSAIEDLLSTLIDE